MYDLFQQLLGCSLDHGNVETWYVVHVGILAAHAARAFSVNETLACMS